MLTVKETAEKLGVTSVRVYQFTKNGILDQKGGRVFLPGTRNGRKVLYQPRDVQIFGQRKRRGPGRPKGVARSKTPSV